MTAGSQRQCPGDGHPLLLAAGELPRVRVQLVGDADPLQQRPGLGLDLLAVAALRGNRRLDDVLQHGEVREEIEVLEDEADPGPLVQDLPLPQFVQLAALQPVADRLAVDLDQPAVDLLQMVEGPQQRRLARSPTGPRMAVTSPRRTVQVDAAQHLQRAERLVHTAHLDGDDRRRGERSSEPAEGRLPAGRR